MGRRLGLSQGTVSCTWCSEISSLLWCRLVVHKGENDATVAITEPTKL
jgi:hypothetical protein